MKKAGKSKAPKPQESTSLPGSIPDPNPPVNPSPPMNKSIPPDGGAGGGKTVSSPSAADKPIEQPYDATMVPPNFSVAEKHHVTAS